MSERTYPFPACAAVMAANPSPVIAAPVQRPPERRALRTIVRITEDHHPAVCLEWGLDVERGRAAVIAGDGFEVRLAKKELQRFVGLAVEALRDLT